MKFTAKFHGMSIDLDAYKVAMLKRLRGLNEKAGQAWINEVVNNTPIPTWSGASRATFQSLARELGTTVPLGPLRTKSRAALGRANSDSRVLEEKSKNYVGFQYSTSLRYLAYNEYHAATAGAPPRPYSNNVRFTPYHFLPRAEKSWQTVANDAKLPDPYKFMKKRKL